MKESSSISKGCPTSTGSAASSWIGVTLRRARYILTSLGDMFLPRTCIVCDTRLSSDERFMCVDCEGDIPLTYYWDIPYNPAADRLNKCIQRKFEVADRPQYEPYSRYAGLFFYSDDNGYRHICQRLKYEGDIALGRHYSRLLGEKIAGSELFRNVDLVVPVPLHWTRLWKRGYNQADIIAQEVAAVLGADHSPRLLKRTRRTQTQTVLSVEEKRRNVAGAFSVNRRALPAKSQPRHILLIDDMMTTGSTLAACHAALREVFPTSVKISAASLGCYRS